jgi:flagellar hook-length control protein FliK
VTSARAAATTNRSGASSEFQQLLSQLDRSRLAGDRGQIATGNVKAKDATARTGSAIDLDAPGSVAELARVVKTQIGSRRSSMVLELSPAELGRVRVDVRMRDSAVALRFATETATGQQEIKSRLSDLKRALERQGITVDRVSVEMLPSTPTTHRGQEPANQPQPDAQQWDVPADGGGWGGSGDMPGSRHQTGGAFQSDEATMPGSSMSELMADWTTAGVDVIA